MKLTFLKESRNRAKCNAYLDKEVKYIADVLIIFQSKS